MLCLQVAARQPPLTCLSKLRRPMNGSVEDLVCILSANLEYCGIQQLLTANHQAVTPKCLGNPPVDHDRLNAQPGHQSNTITWGDKPGNFELYPFDEDVT
ncbi:hypothetical protein TNCV_3823081 [Trichonephila clavipes]|nr:hypothetical protein TNCV_3823081 [Trichonephila clavipes]